MSLWCMLINDLTLYFFQLNSLNFISEEETGNEDSDDVSIEIRHDILTNIVLFQDNFIKLNCLYSKTFEIYIQWMFRNKYFDGTLELIFYLVLFNFIQELKEVFISNLFTLRLLGKFLGFITFLPYRTTTKLPDEMEATYLSIRKNVSQYFPLSQKEQMCFKIGLIVESL